MKLMSNSMVFCEHFVTLNVRSSKNGAYSIFKSNSLVTLLRKKRRCLLLVPSSKKSEIDSDRRTWWQKFFFDDERDSLNIHEDELLKYHKDSDNGYVGDELSEQQKFEVWKRRAEALSELQEAREDARNAENNEWQDWLDNGSPGARKSSDVKDWDDDLDGGDRQGASSSDIEPDKSLVAVVKDLVLRNEDELLYEDKVFRYASSNSAKFLAVLVLVPWAMDFLVHDYVLLPFLDRYVKTVPLAAEMLDVRRSQKFEMIKALNVEKAKFRFEVEIGKSPPLSDEEMWWELRDKALELRDEKRLENRKGFANIWSDMVFGVTLFLLIYFNKSKVALLKFTGYKIINNVSDAGKAFLIILITDIFLGYHSESGWQTLIEVILEHYGLEIDQAVITIFICFVPVVIDACVKLWLFKFLPRFSPNVSNIFREMQRH